MVKTECICFVFLRLLSCEEVIDKNLDYHRWCKPPSSFLIDEGFTGVDEAYGTKFASLGLAEKGSLNLVLEVDTPGGHSSVPPEHTSSKLLFLNCLLFID